MRYFQPRYNNLIQYSLSVTVPMCPPTTNQSQSLEAVWFSMLISLHTTHSASGLHPTAQRQAGEAGGRPATGIMTQTRIERDDSGRDNSLTLHFTRRGRKFYPSVVNEWLFFLCHTQMVVIIIFTHLAALNGGNLVLSNKISHSQKLEGNSSRLICENVTQIYSSFFQLHFLTYVIKNKKSLQSQ